MGPDTLWWGGDLPREGVGVKKFGSMSLETQGKETVWRDVQGYLLGSPGTSGAQNERLRTKRYVQCAAPILDEIHGRHLLPDTKLLLTKNDSEIIIFVPNLRISHAIP